MQESPAKINSALPLPSPPSPSQRPFLKKTLVLSKPLTASEIFGYKQDPKGQTESCKSVSSRLKAFPELTEEREENDDLEFLPGTEPKSVPGSPVTSLFCALKEE